MGLKLVTILLVGGSVAAACAGTERNFGAGTGAAAGTDNDNGGTVSGGTDDGTPPESCALGETATCYESADGTPFQGEPAGNQTTCRLGQRKCKSDGTWSACVGAVGPQSTDTCEPGNDANCNGKPNEDCACDDGSERVCGSGVGSCKQGMQTCKDNAWGQCIGEVPPAAVDSCEPGNDANCDGVPNEGCSNALADGDVCTKSAECATGQCTTFLVDGDGDRYVSDKDTRTYLFCGTTKKGYVSQATSKGNDCDDQNEAVHPTATEVCDGVDNDCNGKADIADGLVLSGSQKTVAAGTDSAVASSGAVYGITYANLNTNKVLFQVRDQGNAAPIPEKDLDTQYGVPAIAGGDASFGAFYKVGTALFFRSFDTAGKLSPASAIAVGTPGVGSSDSSAAHVNGADWFYTASASSKGSIWTYGYALSAGGAPGPYISIAKPGTLANAAVSGGKIGLVWHAGAADGTAPQTIELSLRKADGMGTEESHPPALRTNVGVRKPVIAARKDGGFAVMWSEGTGIQFVEVSDKGAVTCGPISMTAANFEPDQMVPTKRGYLAVSGYNVTVKAQEVLAGCSWGASFANVGSGGAATSHAHIAAGAEGFAVVWDDGDNAAVTQHVYARMFGPNLCD